MSVDPESTVAASELPRAPFVCRSIPSRSADVVLDDLPSCDQLLWHCQSLWFADVYTSTVRVWEPGWADAEPVVSIPNGPYGLGWDPADRLLVLSGGDGWLLRLETGRLREVACLLSDDGSRVREMVVDGWGRTYVGRTESPGNVGAMPSSLVLVKPDGRNATVATGLEGIRGLAMSADGNKLIVGEARRRRITAFSVNDDGSLRDRSVFADLNCSISGLCLDSEGAVWVASPTDDAVMRVTETHGVVETVSTSQTPLDCELGGPNRETLYISAASFGQHGGKLHFRQSCLEAVGVG